MFSMWNSYFSMENSGKFMEKPWKTVWKGFGKHQIGT
jgi:hypothetical protein